MRNVYAFCSDYERTRLISISYSTSCSGMSKSTRSNSLFAGIFLSALKRFPEEPRGNNFINSVINRIGNVLLSTGQFGKLRTAGSQFKARLNTSGAHANESSYFLLCPEPRAGVNAYWFRISLWRDIWSSVGCPVPNRYEPHLHFKPMAPALSMIYPLQNPQRLCVFSIPGLQYPPFSLPHTRSFSHTSDRMYALLFQSGLPS